MVWHFLIVGSLLALFRISRDSYSELLFAFNERATFSWGAALEFAVLIGGYGFLLILLASTKVLVDWLVDGK